MSIAKKVETMMTKQSWIRKMFEQGAILKAKHGAGNVFDFSLGNPNLAPPEKFHQILKQAITQPIENAHAYMPNAGYPYAKKAVADYLSAEQQVDVEQDDVLMTCGAAGAINIILKSILDPGDNVISPAPFFAEYRAYVDNHSGILKTVPCNPDFTLNIAEISKAIDQKTKAVLINSPNNPTGQVYSEDSLKELGSLLEQKSNQFNNIIYIIADEPYRKIIYDNINVPSIFACYAQSMIAASYSKDLSIPGERIGFAAVNPGAEYRKDLINAMTLNNRILGYVNAPALMQQVAAQLQGISVDVSGYAEKRELLCDGLAEAGYKFTKPKGAFYLFPQTPINDDVEFVNALQKELILAVPGSGFGGPGHFRIAFCVDNQTIINAMPGFKRAIDSFKKL